MDSTTRFKGKGLGTKSQEGKLTPASTATVRRRSRGECRLQGQSGTLHATQVTVTPRRRQRSSKGRGDGSRDVAPATSRAAASGELWVMCPRIQRYLRG